MRPFSLLQVGLVLSFTNFAFALPQPQDQDSVTKATTTIHTTSTRFSTSSVAPQTTSTSFSQSPEMASQSVSSVFAALATATPQQTSGDQAPGDDSGGTTNPNAAGASGTDSESLNLSRGGMIAIIVVVVVVAIFGSMC
jgi:hypothetical protein